MGLGPGGQPIDANHLNKGIGMGNIGPAGENDGGTLMGDFWGSYSSWLFGVISCSALEME